MNVSVCECASVRGCGRTWEEEVHELAVRGGCVRRSVERGWVRLQRGRGWQSGQTHTRAEVLDARVVEVQHLRGPVDKILPALGARRDGREEHVHNAHPRAGVGVRVGERDTGQGN